MKIWVDADACPTGIKTILYRAAERKKIPVILVANQLLRIPVSPWVSMVRVAAGFDVADNEIVQRVAPSDLVITADIPLAADVLQKGAAALNPRGELYTADTIKQRLVMRDFMDTMRASGVQSSGPAALNQKDKQHFANALDKWLSQKN